MNLLCPNCQKMLTVPEQSAGQPMKCPLCNGTFTVPALPAGPGPAPGAEPAAAPAASPANPQGVHPGEDVYGVRSEPEARPAAPAAPPAPATPAGDMFAPARAEPDRAGVTGAPEPAPSFGPAPSEGYTHAWSVPFSPRVLQWVPPVAMVLIFLLQFFPWVGLYPGGVPIVTQTAWGAGFRAYTINEDLPTYSFPAGKDKETVTFRMASKDPEENRDLPDNRLRVSLLTLFYLLLFIPSLVITIAAVVLPYTQVKLPPQAEQLMPWRWAILTGLTAVLLLFLVLQLLLNFSLESALKEWFDSLPSQKQENKTTPERLKAQADRGIFVGSLERTTSLKLSVTLHVLAVLAAALVFWTRQRGEGAPVPKLEFRY
jgi:hypothetical protein